MNNIIQRLIDQADAYANKRNELYGASYQEEYNKKFSQLIVKECGRCLDSPEYIGRRDLDWSMVLNDHFGIK